LRNSPRLMSLFWMTLALLAIVIALAVDIAWSDETSRLVSRIVLISGVIVGVIGMIWATAASKRAIIFDLPIAYNVAILGFPRSGKTTLLISLFREMFAKRVGVDIQLRGSQTIEAVNQGLSLLSSGRSLGPTKDQDMFAFRADVKRGKFPSERTYKIEFGDFPGEHSETFVSGQEWFHNNDFLDGYWTGRQLFS